MMIQLSARGVASDVTLTAALLQSDAISHFRSSWSAGMVLRGFLEKAFREAFGETFLSMSISIMAIFTMQFQFKSDLMLMLLNMSTSLRSIQTGVSEAHELSAAEEERSFVGQPARFRLVPLNDFYA